MSVDRKSRFRVLAVAASGVMAVLYLLIGFKVIAVHSVTDVEAGAVVPLVIAGVVFAVLAVVLALWDNRLGWAVCALVPAMITVGYLAVSSHRTPSFEPWGVGMHAVQLVLVAVLVYLAALQPRPTTGAGHLVDHSGVRHN